MSDLTRWDERYVKGDTPWETGRPSSELQRVVAEIPISPCRALELGCGMGANAVWLAQQGFEVTALDLSASAIERARQRADEAGVSVRFLVADVLNPPPELTGPFDFFFDRGCYHVVRPEAPQAYVQTLRRLTHAGTLGLVLAGNAREPHEPGPPVVSEDQIRQELGSLYEIVHLREFRFDQSQIDSNRYLAWSCLLRRRSEAEPAMGKIVSIVHKPAGIDPRPPDHYARVPLPTATLEAGRGIVTDSKGNRPERELNIMALESLEQLRAEGYRTALGEMGEQIVVSGININKLAAGTRLRFGKDAVIEVVKPRTGCDRLRQIQGCTPAQVAGRIGIMARVLVGGAIQLGDAVALIDADG